MRVSLTTEGERYACLRPRRRESRGRHLLASRVEELKSSVRPVCFLFIHVSAKSSAADFADASEPWYSSSSFFSCDCATNDLLLFTQSFPLGLRARGMIEEAARPQARGMRARTTWLRYTSLVLFFLLNLLFMSSALLQKSKQFPRGAWCFRWRFLGVRVFVIGRRWSTVTLHGGECRAHFPECRQGHVICERMSRSLTYSNTQRHAKAAKV